MKPSLNWKQASLLSLGLMWACEDEVTLRVAPDPPPAPQPAEPVSRARTPRVVKPLPDPAPACEAQGIAESFEVYFASRRGCAFSDGGNLSPRNGFIRARHVEVAEIPLPEFGTLCNLTLRSREGPPIAFDDEVVVLFNDVVLVAGGSAPNLAEYPYQGGLPRFIWEDLRGQPLRGPRPYDCLGGGRCEVPRTQELGRLNLGFSAETMLELAQAVDLTNGLRLAFVTFGDNDASDCSHGDIRMDLELRYLP